MMTEFGLFRSGATKGVETRILVARIGFLADSNPRFLNPRPYLQIRGEGIDATPLLCAWLTDRLRTSLPGITTNAGDGSAA
jgi:hypothetical protein